MPITTRRRSNEFLTSGVEGYNAGTMGEEVGSGSYYRWEEDGKPVAVSLRLSVVERLGLAIREGGDTTHRRAEIGGFLLGTVKRLQGQTTVFVEDFEPVACEHAFGESYFLSGDDQRNFAERVRRHKAKGGNAIVGFFRSNTRKEFSLTVEDLGLMERHFSRPSMVLMLVHATAEGALRAGFSIWEQRAIRTTKPYGEFPFEAGALRAASYRVDEQTSTGVRNGAILSSLSIARLRAMPVLRIRVRVTPSRLLMHLRGRLGVKWLAATVFATAVLAGALYRGSRPPEVTVTVIPVERNANRPFASAVHRGPEAVVAGAAVAAVTPMDDVPPKPTVPLPEPAVSAPAKPVESRKQKTASAAPFHIAPAMDTGVPALPPAPEVAMGLPSSPALPPDATAGLPPLAPSIPPFVSFAVEPLPNGHKGLLSRLSGQKNVRGGMSYVPPHLVQQHSIDVPAALRGRMRNGTVPIAVKLYVGREGKVEYAELLSDGTGPNRELASLAVFASRKFRFSPAQEGKQAVPAEVLVRFRFGAAADR